jgi:hypothetical protein
MRSNSLIQIKLSAERWCSQLVEMSRFMTWLRTPRWTSDLVLVDAHCGSAAPDKVFPISAICAALVNTLLDPGDDMSDPPPAPDVRVLYHFCGQHLKSQDPLKGPTGLIRLLLCQIIRQHMLTGEGDFFSPPFSLEFVDDQFLKALGNDNIASLCRLFCELVVQLDESRPIFCIIDGVTELETVLDGSRDGVIFVVNTLLQLVTQNRRGPALRVLLAGSRKSVVLGELVVPLEQSSIFVVPADSRITGVSGLVREGGGGVADGRRS